MPGSAISAGRHLHEQSHSHSNATKNTSGEAVFQPPQTEEEKEQERQRHFQEIREADETAAKEESKSLVGRAKDGDVQGVERCLGEEGVDVNAIAGHMKGPHGIMTDMSALSAASENNHPDIVALLLQQPGIDVNQYVHTYVHVNDKRYDVTALHLAAIAGHVEVVEKLLAHDGIVVNKPDKHFNTGFNGGPCPRTALYYAKYPDILKKGEHLEEAKRFDKCVAMLLEAGARDVQSDDGECCCVQ